MGQQCAFDHVDADAPPAVRQGEMLVAKAITDDRRPRSQPTKVEGVGVRTDSRNGADRQHEGVYIGMPEQPRLGRGPMRVLDESTGRMLGRPPPSRARLTSRPSPGYAARSTRRSQDRGATIPRRGRRDRFRPARRRARCPASSASGQASGPSPARRAETDARQRLSPASRERNLHDAAEDTNLRRCSIPSRLRRESGGHGTGLAEAQASRLGACPASVWHDL